MPTMSHAELNSAIRGILAHACIGEEAGVYIYRLGDRMVWTDGPVSSLVVRPEFTDAVSAALRNTGDFVIKNLPGRLAVAERTEEFSAYCQRRYEPIYP
ncbi:hypothetical protein OH723_24385 [Streptomyces albidoflavus]|uniref:hypothetical protein n=1 Tax=Streptomyces albidoflavus TaxID=1886 RepID=UPI00386DC058|nr:hypothetical protein OH723_24385 [Streptomyces albidoflavus]